MRVTNSMMTNTMLMNLNKNLNKLNKWNNQIATGKKFSKPSDDPISVSKSLELRSTVSEIQQHNRNTEDAISWLEITETATAEIGDILQRTRELAVSADGTETPEDKQKIKAEIDQLKEQLIKVSNTTYAGKRIFSGYRTDQDLLNNNGEYNFDFLNDEDMRYEVGVGHETIVNTLGYKLFGTFDTDIDTLEIDKTSGGKKAQLIEVFDKFSDALDTDNAVEIEKTLSRLDLHMENVLSIRGEIGAKTNNLEMTLNRLEKDELSFTELLSKNEDADMAEVIMKMQMDENVYRASLSIGAKVIQPTLIDFIR